MTRELVAAWTPAELRQMPRAWVVKDPDEERATVVLARNPLEARRLVHGFDGVGEFCDEADLLVERAPEFDAVKDLTQAQFDAGWWWECMGRGCFKHVSNETGVLVNGDAYCFECSEQARSCP